MALSHATVLGMLVVLSPVASAPLSAQDVADLAGSWTLNRQLSQFPTEVGFSATFSDARRVRRESAEDAQRVRSLTDEVRLPYEHLAIVVTTASVTITPNRAPARTFQPGKRDERVSLGRITAAATASWEPGRLVVVYKADAGRSVRYTYSPSQDPKQLIVDVEFVERGGGDKVRRIYEPTAADTTAASSLAPPSTGASSTAATATSQGAAPQTPAALDQRQDASLRGLSRLGVVVEGLGPESAKCGLTQESLEAAVVKHLTDAGLRVVQNSDDDTYLYVNINTVTASAGLCVSRYDVTLYSHTTAKLSHTASPVLLQAELLRKGGLAGGGPAAHADSVVKGVLESVDEFANRIRSVKD